MNMEHGLTRAGAIIDNQTVSFCVQPLVFSDLFCRPEEMSHESLVGFGHAVYFGEVFFRDDEKMHGRLGIDVLEGRDQVVFENDRRGDRSFDDPAEEAVCVPVHSFPPVVPEKLRKKQLRAPV